MSGSPCLGPFLLIAQGRARGLGRSMEAAVRPSQRPLCIPPGPLAQPLCARATARRVTSSFIAPGLDGGCMMPADGAHLAHAPPPPPFLRTQVGVGSGVKCGVNVWKASHRCGFLLLSLGSNLTALVVPAACLLQKVGSSMLALRLPVPPASPMATPTPNALVTLFPC